MRAVAGGTPICDTDQWAQCRCADGDYVCAPGDGISTTATLCNADYCWSNGIGDACFEHGGVVQPMDCVTICEGA